MPGIGGTFLSSRDPRRLVHWFGDALGIHPYGRQPMMLNLRVEDMDATLARLKEKGYRFAGPASYEGIGRFAWTRTPDGHDIELWQP